MNTHTHRHHEQYINIVIGLAKVGVVVTFYNSHISIGVF